MTPENWQTFEQYGIREGGCYEISFDELPTPMMTLAFDDTKDLCQALSKVKGKSLEVWGLDERGLPPIPCCLMRGTNKVVPLDCLRVYYEAVIEPDEEVVFF